MKKARIQLAFVAALASLGLLAACDKGEADTKATSSAPAATTSPETSGSVSGTTQPSAMDELKADAKRAGEAIADTAGDVKDATVEAARDAGDAVREGADKADNEIQQRVGDGSPSTDQPPPASQG